MKPSLLAAPAHCLCGQHTGAAGSDGFMRFGFNARGAQDDERLVDSCVMPPGVLAGSRIVDERNTAHREFLLESPRPARVCTWELCSYLRI